MNDEDILDRPQVMVGGFTIIYITKSTSAITNMADVGQYKIK